MEHTDCFGYIDKYRCAGLIRKNCENCKFYKTNAEYERSIEKAMKFCKENYIYTYDDFFRKYRKKQKLRVSLDILKRKDDENER